MDLEPELEFKQQIDQWMVRTAQNEVRGPYTREAVVQQIQRGELGPDDEVCQANHYWIYLDEREEVQKQLGIEAPRRDGGRDSMETQSDMRTQEIVYPRMGVGGVQSDATELPELAAAPARDAGLLNNRALREFQPRQDGSPGRAPGPAPSKPLIIGMGAVERPSILKWIFAGFVALLLGLVGLVIYVLRFSH